MLPGQTIALTGAGADPDQSASSLEYTWRVTLVHDDHQAQVLDRVGVRLPDRGQEAPDEQAEVLVELA